MNRREAEAQRLRSVPPDALEADLLAHSGLPGARANLELVSAATDVVPAAQLLRWADLDAASAPSGTEREFLPLVGVAGIGRLLVDAADDRDRRILLDRLARHASDPRWRVREGVALALQRFGAADFDNLLDEMRRWALKDDRYLQRAAVAALCEPPLLRSEDRGAAVIAVLDTITAGLAAAPDRTADGFRVLRQALGYGWSVAVAAAPEVGREHMERWLGSPDPDVRWVMRQNMAKVRLTRIDAAWVALWRRNLEGSP